MGLEDVILPDGMNLDQELVKYGWCWWYRKYAPGDTVLEGLEQEAREARKRLWADPQPVPPWEWRKGKSRESAGMIVWCCRALGQDYMVTYGSWLPDRQLNTQRVFRLRHTFSFHVLGHQQPNHPISRSTGLERRCSAATSKARPFIDRSPLLAPTYSSRGHPCRRK
jgi:hypothetical protein